LENRSILTPHVIVLFFFSQEIFKLKQAAADEYRSEPKHEYCDVQTGSEERRAVKKKKNDGNEQQQQQQR
jgi:hypothetical protein